ncbi:glutathione hydrolase 1 [Quercus suber]|uniref:Glutathione hydrolase 1 n=1 Tax=Quercus suber TaxID=58331 RepID=A0AAW0JIU9_QUESU
MKVLQGGGHAVDASVASALCLGVVSPASSGLGGGAFMLLRLSSGKAQAFNMRETALLKASEYAGNATLKGEGALSIAVPGELAGLYKAWKRHERLPWKRLVRPAEHLAHLGFKISPFLHTQMAGDICHNEKLAHTLNKISKFGPVALYSGSIRFKLVRDVQKVGGILTMKDLQSYKVKLKEPISANILGRKLLVMPPPSGDPPMILMLNILAQYAVPSGVSGPLGLHREIDALKHVFSVRMNLGDPDFVLVSKVLSDMLSPKFAKELKKQIFDNMTFDPSHYGGRQAPSLNSSSCCVMLVPKFRWNQIHEHGTSHLSIVDREQNAVAMTTTVNSYFGSLILSPSTGIVLNNEMDDFSIPTNVSADIPLPAPANLIRPGRRPLSAIMNSRTVELHTDEQLQAVVGASGGGKIIAATAEVLLNHFARGMDPFSSVMAPRFYHQLIPNVLSYENWTAVSGDHFEVPADIRAALRKKGHVLQSLSGGTACQFIVQDVGTLKKNGGIGKLVAVSDPRKGGFPAGY